MIDVFKEIREHTDIASTVMSLLPDGRREKNEWIALNPTRDDKRLGSFRINLDTGQWIDFAVNEKGGDIISLYAYLHGFDQHFAAKELLKEKTRFPIPPSSKVSKVSKVDNKIAMARRIWNESQTPENSIVETYLRFRGYHGMIPDSIRFHPKLYHKPTNTYYPAMVSKVTCWPSSKPVGVHRTYLRDGKKADIPNNKMMLGICNGGAVKLSPPSVTSVLILTEGIETGLSVLAATHMPVWATLSTGGLRNVIPPPSPMTIIIASDHDEAGINAAYFLAERLSCRGHSVKLALPEKPDTDFNDLLKEDL